MKEVGIWAVLLGSGGSVVPFISLGSVVSVLSVGFVYWLSNVRNCVFVSGEDENRI